MSDRATIDIDCDRGVVSVSSDQISYREFGNQLETTSSALIVMILMPQFRELMAMNKQQLRERVLEMIEQYR